MQYEPATPARTAARIAAVAPAGAVARITRDGRATVRTATGALVDMFALDLPALIGGDARQNADDLAARLAALDIQVIRTR